MFKNTPKKKIQDRFKLVCINHSSECYELNLSPAVDI